MSLTTYRQHMAFHSRTMKAILCSLVVLILLAAPYAFGKQQQSIQKKVLQEDPKPSLTVVFEQDMIRGNDSIPVTVWIVNNSGQSLQDAHLNISGPSFLEWCDSRHPIITIHGMVALGPLGAHEIGGPYRLFVRLKEPIRLGTFTILFTCLYRSDSTTTPQQSLPPVERTLTVDLLGIREIAGVPIAFAGFIAPGLVFWMVLSLFTIPWVRELEKETRVLLSVPLSIISLILVSIVRSLVGLSDAQLPAGSTAVSIETLSVQVTAGAALGLLSGFIAAVIQRYLMHRQLTWLVDNNKTNARILEAVLKQQPEYSGKSVRVKLKGKGSGVLVAALAVRVGDSVYLFASFHITLDKLTPKQRMKLSTLASVGNKKRLYELPQDPKLLLRALRSVPHSAVEIDRPIYDPERPTVGRDRFRVLQRSEFESYYDQEGANIAMPLLKLF